LGEGSILKVEIREEQPQDQTAISTVNKLAFAGNDEADLVEALRNHGKIILSLVAVHDDRVIGHILFSRITIDSLPEGFSAVGLAPMSVLPEFQNQGIGSHLVRAGLTKCREQGHKVAVVLGHANYYPRFGFVPASRFGIKSEFNVADENFMILEFENGVLETTVGIARYESEFDAF
jgi:putative acetyltransferase